jgi:beta-barrel assembly-enhancing protease
MMNNFRIYHYILPVCIFFFFVSCSTTPPLKSIYTDTNITLSETESNLWKDAESFQKSLDDSDMKYPVAGMENYLNRVLFSLIHEKEIIRKYKPHVKILKNPFLNAFALPNGTIYLHSGILARLDNEAQLAFLLGHELVHFLNRHAFRALTKRIEEARQKALVSIFFSITNLVLPGVTDVIGSYWELAAVTGYSRNLEREADESALVLMAEAGYDPYEAINVFRHMKKEYDQRKVQESFYYGSHPQLNKRIGIVQSFLTVNKNTLASMKMMKIKDETYTGKIAGLLLDNAEADMAIHRFRTAEMAIQRHLAINPFSYRGHYCQGKLILQLNAEAGSTETAIQSFKKSIRLNPSFAPPHREIGLIYYDRQQFQPALYEFRQYLALSNNPLDGPIIRQYINSLSKY